MSAKAVRELLQSAARLHSAGQLDRAELIYQQLLSIRPGQSDAVHLLGVIACQRQQFEKAVSLISRAISSSPKESAYHNSLGNALRSLERLPEAIASFRKACELDANNLEALNNLAIALESADHLDESLACFDLLIQSRGNVAQIHANRGNAQLNAGQIDDAILSYRRALQLQPDFAVARAKLSTALLTAGQFEEGWREGEARFAAGILPDPTVGDPAPRWDGSPLVGRTLLIRTEQGFGDSIQFVRYARLIDKGGGKIIVQCQPPLKRLFETNQIADEVIAVGEAVPWHDVQIPIMSLPSVFNTDLATIPPAPTWNAPVTLLLPDTAKRRVGLVWSGNPTHGNDRRRSCPADLFNVLADVPSIEFHRLQLPSNLPPPSVLPLIDRTDQLMDFSDTAGLISQLDLVISADTSVAHLAATMGKNVWILVPFLAEWRWLTVREDSPWYPGVRLFRQNKIGDWKGVIQRVRNELMARTGVAA